MSKGAGYNRRLFLSWGAVSLLALALISGASRLLATSDLSPEQAQRVNDRIGWVGTALWLAGLVAIGDGAGRRRGSGRRGEH